MSGQIMGAAYDGVYELKFVGDIRLTFSHAIDGFVAQMFNDAGFKSVFIDLSETDAIDSTSLGLLAKLSIEAKKRFNYAPTLVSTHSDVTRILDTMGFDDVFHIINAPLRESTQLRELPRVPNIGKDELRRRVIDAHRTLSSMNPHNCETFKDLLADLEAEEEQEP